MADIDPIYYDRLTKDNCALCLIDHQTGTMLGVQDIKLSEFRSNTLALAQIGQSPRFAGRDYRQFRAGAERPAD